MAACPGIAKSPRQQPQDAMRARSGGEAVSFGGAE